MKLCPKPCQTVTSFWMPVSGCSMLDARCWILDTGCWILDAGYWMLDAGCWMLDAGFKILILIVIVIFQFLIPEIEMAERNVRPPLFFSLCVLGESPFLDAGFWMLDAGSPPWLLCGFCASHLPPPARRRADALVLPTPPQGRE